MSQAPARQVIERVWNAPIALVWELWTTPAGVESWHGPNGFRTDVQRMEVEAGGAWEYTMTATDPDKAAWMKANGRPVSWPARARFVEVSPMTRLVFELMMPTGSGEAAMLHTVELQETADGVHMRLTLEGVPAPMMKPAAGGYAASFGRMEAVLAAAG